MVNITRTWLVMRHRKQNLDVAKHRHRKWPTSMSSMYRNLSMFSRKIDNFNISPVKSMIFSIIIIIAMQVFVENKLSDFRSIFLKKSMFWIFFPKKSMISCNIMITTISLFLKEKFRVPKSLRLLLISFLEFYSNSKLIFPNQSQQKIINFCRLKSIYLFKSYLFLGKNKYK